jgi:hypothetical protein
MSATGVCPPSPRVLSIAASTYYGWRARRPNPSSRARRDAELLAMIDEIRGEHEFAATYGSRSRRRIFSPEH